MAVPLCHIVPDIPGPAIKLLGHIHVPVEIDIAVGRMVVIAVERK